MQALAIPEFFGQIIAYREYLKQSVLRDLRNKYKRSLLGYLWAMLHPLCMMAVLAVVFSNIINLSMRDYAVFLLCGLLPWNFFSSTVIMSLGSMRNNARLFSHTPVPKYIFVLSTVFSNLFNLVVAIVPLLLVSIVLGHGIPLTVLALPIILLPIICVVVGISLIAATSNVFFNDTAHLAEVFISVLYFLSPILYSRDNLPPSIVQYLVLNPLFCQVEFFRGIFYEGVLPNPEIFLLNLCVSIFILFFGLFVFARSEDKFMYFI